MEYKKYVEILNEKRSIITNELFIIIVINRRHRLVLSFLSLSFPFHLFLFLSRSLSRSLSLSLSLPFFGEEFFLLTEISRLNSRNCTRLVILRTTGLCAKEKCSPVSQTSFDNVAVCFHSLYAIYRTYMYVHVYRIHVN